ncbi:uncharacterized protein LOC111018819 [Momordica charantia]|uniref:Uncharacterized protein LOC111018819 n=1 Tax=Momordica charantia TaxID=3673 RepID=A0A6J1DAA6_MOMCH|nr:uncharacterized protein LOC111018819 [Momordica charantia]
MVMHKLGLSRTLYLKMESGSCLDDWIEILLKRCEELQLVGSIGARVLTFELVENECSHLKHLHLFKNREFQHLIHQQNKPLRKTLSNLEDLQLRCLENLESIIDGHGHVTELAFNKLRSVDVEYCHKMGTLFYNCMVDDILNLEDIFIYGCEMLEYLITVTMESKETTATIEFPHLKSLELRFVQRVRGFCSKMDQIGNESSFFSEEVLLPNLEDLIITMADNLKMIWQNVLVPISFSKLKRVEIDSCNNVEKAFPPNITTILTCLQSLTVMNCNLLKCIFELQEPNTTEKSIVLSNLRYLKLYNLPSLEYVWSKDSSELSSFENMESLFIQGCPNLKRAYSIKVLKQQKELGIDFNQLKEILEKEKLSVHMMDSNQFQTSQAGTTQLQDGLELFPKLKTLKLYGYLDYNSTHHLPMEMFRMVHNLEEFEARRMFIKEIFPNERLMNVEEQKINTRFEPSRLGLYELPKLKHFWKDEFKSSSSLQKLYDLIISGCGVLDMLVPSSVSFTNLWRLEVNKCHRLTHLLNPSVAKTLVQLTWLCLKECKRMTTVIAREVVEDQGNDEIVFHKLYILELEDLSKLTSFHSGNCNIRFPCLGSVDIRSCPEMKAFSPGITSTPNLLVGDIKTEGSFSRYGISGSNGRHVNTTEVVEDINGIIRQVWEDDYDDGIQYLFTEKNLEEDQISDHPSSQ